MVNFYDKYDRNPIKVSHDYDKNGSDDYIFAEVAESIVDENVGAGLQNIVTSKNDSKKRILSIKAATKESIGGVIVGNGLDVQLGKISLDKVVIDAILDAKETADRNLQKAKNFTIYSIDALKDNVGTAFDTLKEIEEKFKNDDDVTASIITTITNNKAEINDRVDQEVITINNRVDQEVNTLNFSLTTEIHNLRSETTGEIGRLDARIDDLTESTTNNLNATKVEIKNRIDSEVNTLNLRIDEEATRLNSRINNEVLTLNNLIAAKETELSTKIGKVQSNLTAHENNKNNPHQVTATQVGLGNVTNESKVTMFNNPKFTGIVTMPTVAASDSSEKGATTAYVTNAIKDYALLTTRRHIFATATFNGMDGVIIPHTFGVREFACIINPVGIPKGTVGDISYEKSDSSVTVYNTGDATAQFDITLIKIP